MGERISEIPTYFPLVCSECNLLCGTVVIGSRTTIRSPRFLQALHMAEANFLTHNTLQHGGSAHLAWGDIPDGIDTIE